MCTRDVSHDFLSGNDRGEMQNIRELTHQITYVQPCLLLTWIVHSSSDDSSRQVPTKSKDKHCRASCKPCTEAGDGIHMYYTVKIWLAHVLCFIWSEQSAAKRLVSTQQGHIQHHEPLHMTRQHVTDKHQGLYMTSVTISDVCQQTSQRQL